MLTLIAPSEGNRHIFWKNMTFCESLARNARVPTLAPATSSSWNEAGDAFGCQVIAPVRAAQFPSDDWKATSVPFESNR